MSKRMLIDASHREETRVVVLDGNKVGEFDFEAAAKRPLKGNIYLAKVTRVEPSLQAAFVEYGGNRQGFLAFAEIHPDYYQIPIADRLALLAEQEAEARRRSDDDVEAVETAIVPAQESAAEAAAASPDAPHLNSPAAEDSPEIQLAESPMDVEAEQPDMEGESEGEPDGSVPEVGDVASDHDADLAIAEFETAQAAAPIQAQLQAPRPIQRWARKRHYKIQEVIKRRQVILVQAVKEERGNKGAALTTYLSLAGRYCVLMPNTPRGGGISRKITNAVDRNRLKSAAQSLELPEGMGLIIRTAGENRTKAEIKRDYEYLLRMWDTIRELTLQSNAPACVYEEGDLIKRAIRDLYNKDVSEIIVEGEDGYRNAKDFMRMLMPSHAKNVRLYKEPVPLFQRFQIESQLDAMFMPTVTLRSGGYIVINQTEALVSIDVNSGKATREHSIEDTAYKTNMEAAEEIARQLRLRDLAGLIVIDFIDMEDTRNDRNVEKRLRDSVKIDRARVQIGKISQFGLLEMSRQRLRAGVVAGSTVPCPHCGGQGIVRSVESTALRLLRALEEEAERQRASTLGVKAQTEVAIYALNQKRRELARIESDYALTIQFEPKDGMLAGTFEIDRIGHRAQEDRPNVPAVSASAAPESELPEIRESVGEPQTQAEVQQQAPQNGSKRRRRRRRGRDRATPPVSQSSVAVSADASVAVSADAEESKASETAELISRPTVAANDDRSASDPAVAPDPTRKRRRRRRGRRGSRENGSAPAQDAIVNQPLMHGTDKPQSRHGGEAEHPSMESAAVPNAPSQPVWSLSPNVVEAATASAHSEPVDEEFSSPRARHSERESTEATDAESSAQSHAAPPHAAPEKSAEPPRKGWWQRPFRARE
jgi:ribonuclease E